MLILKIFMIVMIVLSALSMLIAEEDKTIFGISCYKIGWVSLKILMSLSILFTIWFVLIK